VYRINLRAKRVFDTSASTKFCSDECARRSAWFETVCLASNNPLQQRFASPGRDRIEGNVQLLEDLEDDLASASHASGLNATTSGLQTGSDDASPRLVAAAYPAPPSSVSEFAVLPPPQIAHDEFSQLADNFLARLAIIERANPQPPPVPPSFAATHLNVEDSGVRPGEGVGASTSSSASTRMSTSRFASSGTGSAADALLPFDMAPLQRDLMASARQQQQPLNVGEAHGGGKPGRRIEVDVDPEDQEYMDIGWELFKQLKESGEMESS